MKKIALFCLLLSFCYLDATIKLGVDGIFEPENVALIKNKQIGIITNHTAVNGNLESTIDLFKTKSSLYGYTIKAFFGPEHGLTGVAHASAHISDSKDKDGVPIYSLHGTYRRPTANPFLSRRVGLSGKSL